MLTFAVSRSYRNYLYKNFKALGSTVSQNIKNGSLQCQIMTNWHESSLMIVKSADPRTLEGASLKKMLNEIEALILNGYTLKLITECNGEMFVFLLNESEIKRQQK